MKPRNDDRHGFQWRHVGAAGERETEKTKRVKKSSRLGKRSLNGEVVANAGEASDGAGEGLQGVAAQGELHFFFLSSWLPHSAPTHYTFS